MDQTIVIFILGVISVVLLLIVFLFMFVQMAQKRHWAYKRNVEGIKIQYAQEKLKSEVEIQNNILQHISEEIHDNLGQLLSLAKLNLAVMEKQTSTNSELITDTKNILNEVIIETRNLTRSISGRTIQEKGLEYSLQNLVNRISQNGKIKAHLKYQRSPQPLNQDSAVIIYRIIQEATQNAIKHANCKKIEVDMIDDDSKFEICIKDDGLGFDVKQQTQISSGQGLGNFRHKAEILNASLNIQSNAQGTTIQLKKVPS